MALSEWTKIFLKEADGLLHGDTWHLNFNSSIVANQTEPGWLQYIRNTSARFQCSQCPRSWPSNRVMVLFHMRLTDGVGHVQVRQFRQNCKNCSEAQMVAPQITPENIAILMRSLVKKIRMKCYHEDLDQGGYYYEKVEVKSPHEPTHCEACQAGICTQE